MDKSLMIFIAIGMGFLYFVTTFVGDIQAKDDAYRNNSYNEEEKYNKYKAVDSIGQDILDLTGANAKMQVDVWDHSLLKEDFLAFFPDFSTMKDFVNDRIVGDVLKNKLINKVNTIEDKFFSGDITAEDAKRELSTIK